MSLHPSLFRITHADDEAIADAAVEGSALSPFSRVFNRNVEPQALRAWSKEFQALLTGLTVKGDTADTVETGVKPLVRPGDISGIKVVTQDGLLVARAIWKYAPKKESLEKGTGTEEAGSYPRLESPAGSNQKLKDEFVTKIIALIDDTQPKGEHLALMELMTSVKFRRLGAGRRLVQWGLQQADELGLPVYLTSSPDGYHVYSKLNFRELDNFTILLEEYGGEGAHVQTAMLWDPVTQVGTPAN